MIKKIGYEAFITNFTTQERRDFYLFEKIDQIIDYINKQEKGTNAIIELEERINVYYQVHAEKPNKIIISKKYYEELKEELKRTLNCNFRDRTVPGVDGINIVGTYRGVLVMALKDDNDIVCIDH